MLEEAEEEQTRVQQAVIAHRKFGTTVEPVAQLLDFGLSIESDWDVLVR